MLNSTIAERYAQALFQVAFKEKHLSDIEEEVRVLEKIVRQDRIFKSFLESPQIGLEDKIELVEKVFRKRLSTLVVNFILLLLKKHRIQYLLEACEILHALCRKQRGVSQAQVKTAVALAGPIQQRLQTSLEKLTRKKLELDVTLDMRLIGGLTVQIDDLLMDGSVRFQLEQLEKAWNQAKI